MINASVLVFMCTSFSTAWIALFTFNPEIVKLVHPYDIFPRPAAEPDPVKCFIYAFLIMVLALAVVFLVDTVSTGGASV